MGCDGKKKSLEINLGILIERLEICYLFKYGKSEMNHIWVWMVKSLDFDILSWRCLKAIKWRCHMNSWI